MQRSKGGGKRESRKKRKKNERRASNVLPDQHKWPGITGKGRHQAFEGGGREDGGKVTSKHPTKEKGKKSRAEEVELGAEKNK